MEFKQELEILAEQISQRKIYISNEEATKQSLILPFIKKLGYDVYNPLEVEPEYTSDFGFKKGEKVDYAIKKENKPIIFVEAKYVNEEINRHSSQLYRYFNASPDVRFSILTNGIHYKLFTDLNQDNIMDDEPFYSFDIENLTSTDIEVIYRMSREQFSKEDFINFSQELVYMANVNNTLKDLFKNPSDDFIRFLIKDIKNQRVTNALIERFRPIVKKSINRTLLDMIGEGLTLSGPEDLISMENDEKEKNEINEDEFIEKEQPVTTEDELRAFEIIEKILATSERDVTNLGYRDNLSYFNVIDRVITNWFLRLYVDREENNIITKLDVELAKKLCPTFKVEESPKGKGLSRIYFNDINDLYEMKNLIIACFDEVKKR